MAAAGRACDSGPSRALLAACLALAISSASALPTDPHLPLSAPSSAPLPLPSTLPSPPLSPQLRGGSTSNTSPEVKWQPSAASELHDNANLLILSLLGFGSVYALATNSQVSHRLLTRVGFWYVVADSVWLLAVPGVVKSPGVVIAHHIATLLVLLDPLLEATHSVYTSACLLVEINTLLLLLRRKLSYSVYVEVPFIITWVLLRNLWYPLLMVYFMFCAAPQTLGPLVPNVLHRLRSQLEGPGAAPMRIVSMVSWTCVCILQLKWTGQLFAQHPWFGGRSRARAKRESKSKGYL